VLWDVAAGAARARFGKTPHPVACLAVLAGSGFVLTGQGAAVRVWDPATGREEGRLAGHTDAVRAVSAAGDGRLGLTGSDARTLRLWDLSSGREVRRLAGHRGRVAGAALSPDGRLALSGGGDGALSLWDVANGRRVRTFAAPRGAVLAVAFTPDGAA